MLFAMRRPTSLLLLLMTASVLAQDPPTPPPPPRGVLPVPKEGGWMKRHEEFVATAKKGPIPVLFLGDSITEGWYRKDIRKIWDERFAPLSAANFGISGDRTQHLLWRLQNGEFDGQTPKVAVLLIGINNIGQKDPEPPESAAAGIEAVVGEIRRRSPTTKILLQAVFPAGERPDHPYRAGVRRIALRPMRRPAASVILGQSCTKGSCSSSPC